jgi:hypothetical protein
VPIGRAAGQTAAGAGGTGLISVSVTLPQNVVAGNFIAGGVQQNFDPTSFSCSDNLSNAYQSDVFRHTGNPHFEGIGVFSCLKIATGGACTVTFNGTFGGADSMGAVVMEYSGFGSGGAVLDKTATNVGSTTSVDSGTTAATTAADELLFAFVGNGFNLDPITYGNSFSKLTEPERCSAADRIVAATGTYNATGTGTTAVEWTGGIATYKASASSPVITAQPQDTRVLGGATASFSVTATGATSYQWQKEDAVGAGTYTDIGGATSSSYTTPTLATTDNGFRYRCNVTNANGTTTSSAAFLGVDASPAMAKKGLFDPQLSPKAWW